MLRAAALVTWDAGPRCEAAIIARELEIPCVVLPRAARGALQEGGVVTVDGTGGLVFGGSVVDGCADR
jgi:pyruvate,water dikinase